MTIAAGVFPLVLVQVLLVQVVPDFHQNYPHNIFINGLFDARMFNIKDIAASLVSAYGNMFENWYTCTVRTKDGAVYYFAPCRTHSGLRASAITRSACHRTQRRMV